ncbi:hypothetical protein RYX36_012235, partial [Vicia faba]
LTPSSIVAEAIRKVLIKLYIGNFLQYSELKPKNRREERHAYFDLFKDDHVNRLTQATQNDNNVDGSEKLQLWKEAVGGQAGTSTVPSSVHPSSSDHYNDDSDGQPLDLEGMSDGC